jgi:hypothetical protein
LDNFSSGESGTIEDELVERAGIELSLQTLTVLPRRSGRVTPNLEHIILHA